MLAQTNTFIPQPIPHIAIVGAGFSGTLALANLVEKASAPLAIDVFEANGVPGTGIAYGTADTAHLLNVRAERMGAFAGKPDGFYHWLHSHKGEQSVASLWPDHNITPESYIPRALYGSYLKHVFEETLNLAAKKGITVHMHHASVVDAELHDTEKQTLKLAIDRGGLVKEMLVDALVLATGNLPPRRFGFQTGLIRGDGHYVPDVWHPAQGSVFPKDVSQLSADSEIVVIGTGLTMVDTVLTLKAQGYKGTITAISRHGRLPAVHEPAKPYKAWEWTTTPRSVPRTALELLHRLRKEIEHAEQEGYDWRSVIDSIRPVTQSLWKGLSTPEKRKFMRLLLSLWNIHRHRMAPAIHAEIKSFLQSGTLKVIAGKIYYVGSDEDGLTIAFRRRSANRIETIRAALVLNCTGPEYDIATSTHRLLRNLRDRELITIGPLRMGIEVTKHGTARGRAPEAIFPVGSLLLGELLECTAVPELRDQADKVATGVLKHLEHLHDKRRWEDMLIGAWI